uniref:Uncharacterized protein n=1 Tax=Setaria digitata TaxID=48799 RepID=A0A915PHW5_9BILA
MKIKFRGGSHETATNRDIKPERCVPLDLISSAAIPAYDLLITGYIDVHKVPPILFRYTTSSKSFTVRSFAATRFGSHRPRPDHVAMRRIQHAAAYLAMMNDELMNAPAINNLQGNFHYMSAQDDRGRQYSLAVPFLPGTYPAPFAGYNQAVSAAEAPNAPSITYYQPNNTSSTYAANSGPVVSNPSNNFTMPAQYAAVYPPQAPAAVRVDFIIVPNYDIWKPVQTLPIDSCDGGTNPVNNYIFDVPPYHSEYTQHQVNPELPQEGTDTDMNELQQNLANFSFLDMSPQLTSPSLSPVQIFTPQISQACLSPVQVSSPQILTTQIPLVQVMPSQLPQASPLQVYPAQVSQPQLFSPQMSPQQVLPAQVLPAQVLQPQAIQPQVAPQQMLHPQVIPSQIVPTHVPIQHLSPPLVLQPQVSPPQIAPHLVLQQQISPPQIAPQLVLQPQVSSPQVLPPTVMQQGATPPYTMQVQVAPTCAPQSQDPLPNTADNSKAK